MKDLIVFHEILRFAQNDKLENCHFSSLSINILYNFTTLVKTAMNTNPVGQFRLFALGTRGKIHLVHFEPIGPAPVTASPALSSFR